MLASSWVPDAIEWLKRQPLPTSGERNLKSCFSVWSKLASGEGVASLNRPGDPFCEGIKVDPRVYDIQKLRAQSPEWLWPVKPPKKGPVPGRCYDKGRGWKVNTQVVLLCTYAESLANRSCLLVCITKAFKGQSNSELEKAAGWWPSAVVQKRAVTPIQLEDSEGDDDVQPSRSKLQKRAEKVTAPPLACDSSASCDKECSESVCTDVLESNVLDTSCDLMSDYASLTKMEDKLRAFTDALHREGLELGENLHPHVKTVYLGRVFPYTNWKHSVTTSELHNAIDAEFWVMSTHEYERHALRDFFEPRKNAAGYEPIMIRCKKSKQKVRLGAIDHVVPKAWSFLEHPRFFVYMHTRVNSHMSDFEPPEYRIASGLTRSEVREMQGEIQKIKKNKALRDALEKVYAGFEDKLNPRYSA